MTLSDLNFRAKNNNVHLNTNNNKDNIHYWLDFSEESIG